MSRNTLITAIVFAVLLTYAFMILAAAGWPWWGAFIGFPPGVATGGISNWIDDHVRF